jgi:hypothetical protein
MGRFADFIRCHILEEYMSSYMRERGVDAVLVLRNENKWAMTGKYYGILFHDFFFSLTFLFCFDSSFLSVILWYFRVLVADVEVREDCVFIRLRKEAVVCEGEDSDKEVSSSGTASLVEEVPEIGSEVAVSLEAVPEYLVSESGEAFFPERVNNISMEELSSGGQCDGSVTSSSDIS